MAEDRTIEEMIAALANADTESSQSGGPIGVPEFVRDPETGEDKPFGVSMIGRDILPPGVAGPPAPPMRPQYFSGDEFRPASFSVENITRLQSGLAAAGLLSGRFQLGRWDDSSVKAYKDLLAYANRTGLEWDDALRDYAATESVSAEDGTISRGGEGGGRTRAPFVAQLPNPLDVAAGVSETTRAQIGRALDNEEVQKYVQEYQQQVAGAQRAGYNAAGAGGTVTNPASVSAFTEAKLKEDRPQDVFNTDLTSAFGTLRRMIGQVKEVTL